MARFKKGDYKVQDDITGAIVNASECRMMWNGLFVHRDNWFPRQPQDTLRPIKDRQAPPIPRPFGQPEFLPVSNPEGATFSDGTGITWSDGTQVQWSAGDEE